MVLLVLFGAILFFGIRRGWFIRKADQYKIGEGTKRWDSPGDQEMASGKVGATVTETRRDDRWIGELNGDPSSHQIHGNEIYQLDGKGKRY